MASVVVGGSVDVVSVVASAVLVPAVLVDVSILVVYNSSVDVPVVDDIVVVSVASDVLSLGSGDVAVAADVGIIDVCSVVVGMLSAPSIKMVNASINSSKLWGRFTTWSRSTDCNALATGVPDVS